MTQKPNILFLTHRVPFPPNRGDRIRSYHMLRYLSQRANVSLACLTEEPVTTETESALDSCCERVAIQPLSNVGRWARGCTSLLTGHSATTGLFASPRLAETVRTWAESTAFDAVLAFCSSMVQFTQTEALYDVPLVVDLVDVDSEKWFNYADKAPWWKRPLYLMEARRVRRLEQTVAQSAKAVTLVSQQEAELLRRFCDTGNIHAVSNGVDLDYFRPQDASGAEDTPAGNTTAVGQDAGAQNNSPTLKLVFVGVLDYRANLEGLRWFCLDVWPRVRELIPHAELTLVGRRPGEPARKLAETPGVALAGEVPDVRPYVRDADVVIAPLTIARGIQNKVLEALAMAKPVVATPQAIEGIEATPGEHILSAETPAEWATALSELAEDVNQRDRLAVAGRRLIEAEYDWPARLQPLQQLLGLASTSTAEEAASATRKELSLTP